MNDQTSVLGDEGVDQELRVRVTPSTHSPELIRIVTRHLPRWLNLFAKKNAEYQDDIGSFEVTGLGGQFCDIYRKVMKLRRPMLLGENTLTTEDMPTIIRDLIGHCFLTLDILERTGQTGLAPVSIVEAELLERTVNDSRYGCIVDGRHIPGERCDFHRTMGTKLCDLHAKGLGAPSGPHLYIRNGDRYYCDGDNSV